MKTSDDDYLSLPALKKAFLPGLLVVAGIFALIWGFSAVVVFISTLIK